MDRSDIDC